MNAGQQQQKLTMIGKMSDNWSSYGQVAQNNYKTSTVSSYVFQLR
jgi:hypothetical protein